MPDRTNSNSTQSRSGVFISYARSDGEKFASLLGQRLQKEKIRLWQDREGMEGGVDWWLQIKEALDSVEFMALVMTPNALKSDTVRKEWRYARQQGVCVYPIKGTRDLDFSGLPRWMRSAHFYDLGTVRNRLNGPEWKKFTNDLKTRCQVRRVPFMVEPLPEGHVSRIRELDQLIKLLINEKRDEPVAISVGLRGAGGYGKTTLAKELCHDERIQDAFDDGILWITLGEHPGDLKGIVEDLIVTLVDARPGFATLDAAVNRLKELLADRDILIVIDDVWDRTHLNPFTQGGPGCARLITTRNLDTLPAGVERIHVDAMQHEEATALLAASLDENLLQDRRLRRELTKLASFLGEWPLLLCLANGSLRNGIENENQSPRDAIAWINKALTKRGLTYLDARKPENRNRAVATTIGVSLELLSSDERERYCELAIFPKDVEIPLDTLEKLWERTGGLDEIDTKELCSHLNSLSLLWSFDANRRRIRLHDVVRRFLIQLQLEKLPSIHEQLLDAHRPASPSWSEMPEDEPYMWEHLAHHLTNAGRSDELLATVRDWRYLVTKTLIRKALTVEADLLAAEKIADDSEPLRILKRNFANSGHILDQCENRNELITTLFSRVQHLEDLKWLTTSLEESLNRPCVVPTHKLPDLPHPALVRTLTGHEEGVSGCAVSGDAATIVSASYDKTLKVWDGQSGSERFTLLAHAGINDCAVSADGATIISAFNDGTLKVWDAGNGAERHTLSGHTGGVRGCALSEDGTMIVSASEDKSLKIWDGRNGAERLTLSGYASAVRGCAVSEDGTTIVSAFDDKTLKVLDGQNGDELFTVRGDADAVNGAVSKDGATIVSAFNDGTLKVLDGRSGKEFYTLSDDAAGVIDCAISSDGATIVSVSQHQTVKIWYPRSGTQQYALSGHAGLVNRCAVNADGTMIVSASDDRTLKVWDGQIGAERLMPSAHTTGMSGCAVSSDGLTIVSTSDDKTLRVWNGQTATERFTVSGDARVNGCAISGDGTIVVAAYDDHTLKVWNGRTGKERFTLKGHRGVVRGCAVNENGRTIVSASDDKTLKVWDGRTGVQRFALKGHVDWVGGCAVSKDGKTIVSASEDGTLRVWDALKGARRFTLRGHNEAVNECAISKDGKTIISASDDRMLKVWDGKSGTERFTLTGHASWVRGCAVSADGTVVVSTSDDQTLRVWDALTGQRLATLRVDGRLEGCACSADGKTIVAVGPRGIYFLRLIC